MGIRPGPRASSPRRGGERTGGEGWQRPPEATDSPQALPGGCLCPRMGLAMDIAARASRG